MSNAQRIKNQRYEVIIKELINSAIIKDVYNKYIKLATITDVRLTNDKSIAKIYISCYDKTLIDKVLKNINDASGFFRTILAKELNWRKAPQVVFVKDVSNDNYDEVESIIKSWKENSSGQ